MNKTSVSLILASLVFVLSLSTGAFAGNHSIYSFSKAKKILQREVYKDHRITVYCGATFDERKQVTSPPGFQTTKYKKRSKKIEWEHVVPAENFGQTFKEWRDGDSKCVDGNGRSFKGRNCARKMAVEFRYLESDLYNLYPAIGAVNASRSNYNFTLIPGSKSSFGACDMRIEGGKAQPPRASASKCPD
jgi:deoxyribonuclease-1